MRQIVNISLCAVILLAVSACQPVSPTATPANDLIKLATPEIERYESGSIMADRLPMIRYNEDQPCTDDLVLLARTNVHTMTIEQCLQSQWQTIGTLHYGKPTCDKSKPIKKRNPAKSTKKKS